MATKPLKSITFPGIDNVYTAPQVDATLTQTGAAADAKKTGDEISGLKNDLTQYESENANKKNLYKTGITANTYEMNNTGLVSTGTSARSISLNVKPSTRYRIHSTVASHKRVGTFTTFITNGRTANAFAKQDTATTEDILITTGDTDRLLLVQLFTDADNLSASDFYDNLIVSEDTVADDVARSESLLEVLNLPITFEAGGISASNGNDQSSNYVCRTGFVDALSIPDTIYWTGLKEYVKSDHTVNTIGHVYEYAKDSKGSAYYLRRKLLVANGVYHRSVDCSYVRFTCGWTTSAGVAVNTNDVYQIFGVSVLKNEKFIETLKGTKSWRVANAIARMRQASAIGYVTTAIMPNQSADMTAGGFYHGVPYSSVRALDTYIGIDVSLHTFWTAVQNPKSVLYKRKSTNGNSKTYYGTVCSALVDFCYGVRFPYTTEYMADTPDYTEKDIWDAQPGDVLVNDAHAIIIADVEQDALSRATSIGVVQAAPPRVYYTTYTPDELQTFMKNNGYKLYAFTGVSENGYIPCQYVKGYEDETLDMSYPDIMSEYGDKAVILSGQDVAINILDGTGYTSINVYKNGTLVDTKSVVDDFTITAIEYGTWKVELVGDGVSSASEFIAVDASGCSYDTETHIVTFASANATPIGVNAYNSGGGGMGHLVRLTADDVTRGTYDMSDIVDDEFQYIRVAFRTDWGQTAWRSYDLHLWTTV